MKVSPSTKIQQNSFQQLLQQQIQLNSQTDDFSQDHTKFQINQGQFFQLNQQSISNIHQKNELGEQQESQAAPQRFFQTEQTQDQYLFKVFKPNSHSLFIQDQYKQQNQINNSKNQIVKQQNQINQKVQSNESQQKKQAFWIKNCVIFGLIFMIVLSIIVFQLSAYLGISLIILIFLNSNLLDLCLTFRQNKIINILQSFQNVQQKYKKIVIALKIQYCKQPLLVIQINKILSKYFCQYQANINKIKILNELFQRQKSYLSQEQSNNYHIFLVLDRRSFLLKQIKQSILKQFFKFTKQKFRFNSFQTIFNYFHRGAIQIQIIQINQRLCLKFQLLLKVNLQKYGLSQDASSDIKQNKKVFSRLPINQYLIKLSSKKDQSIYFESLIHFNILIQWFKFQKNRFDLNNKQDSNLDEDIISQNKLENVLSYLEEEINIKRFNTIYEANLKKKEAGQTVKLESLKQFQVQVQKRNNNFFCQQHRKKQTVNQSLTFHNEKLSYQQLNCQIDKVYLDSVIDKISKKNNLKQEQKSQTCQLKQSKNQCKSQYQQQTQNFCFVKQKPFCFSLNGQIENQLRLKIKIVQDFPVYQ